MADRCKWLFIPGRLKAFGRADISIDKLSAQSCPMALLEPVHELPHEAVGFLLGCLIVGPVVAVLEPYYRQSSGDCATRAAEACEAAAKATRNLERQIPIESKFTGETRQY